MAVLEALRGGLIVSCQAEGDSPFNSPLAVSLLAQAAVQGGAIAIRSEGLAKTQQILADVAVPVIGLLKDQFADGSVCISRDLAGVAALLELGCALVAIDGTAREFAGLSGPAMITRIRHHYPEAMIVADIAQLSDAAACLAAGAACLSTTLSGYTPETQHLRRDRPDLALVQALCKAYPQTPIIAEGRINSPHWLPPLQAAGAWAVVVGSAITRPVQLTQSYVAALASVSRCPPSSSS